MSPILSKDRRRWLATPSIENAILTPCQIEIIHKVYPPVIHVLYACVYMLRIHLMYNLCSRSKYTCYPLWCITRVALDV